MGNNSTLILVLCLTFVGVFAINAVIIMWARRKDPMSEAKIFRNLYDTARSPLKPGDDQITELSNLVSELKKGTKTRDINNQEENG